MLTISIRTRCALALAAAASALLQACAAPPVSTPAPAAVVQASGSEGARPPGTTSPGGAPSVAGAPIERSAAPRGLGRLPMHFEENQGQTGPDVKYLSRGPGYTVHLTPTETIIALRGTEGATERACAPSRPCPTSTRETAVLRMRLMGAAPDVELAATDELPGRAHYLVGADRAKWRTDVPLFGKVRARDAYPGIDVVYYGNGEQLEHDFVVAPGADPSRIRIAYDGQSGRLRVDERGDLVVPVAGGEVIQRAPVTYQERAGGREPVAARYLLHESSSEAGERQEVGFALAAYDATRPLVIDPVLAYSTYLGGTDVDTFGIVSIAVDAAGSAYVTGLTDSLDFPTAAPFQPTAAMGEAFVTKFTPDGTGLVYSTYLGGSNEDFGMGIAVDATGSAYVFGLTLSTDFPLQSALQPVFGGGTQDFFVTKLSPSGGSLVYSTFLGGNAFEGNQGAIAVDAAGSAYVVGFTESPNFPTQSPIQATLRGSYDPVVAKLSPSGTSLVYSTYLGSSSDDNFELATDVAVDAAGSAYVTGWKYSPGADFPLVAPFQSSCTNTCGFVAKLTSSGTALSYSTFLGGSSGFGSRAEAIAVDAAGNAYVAGWTTDADFPTTPGAFQTSALADDAFVTKFTPAGTVAYSTRIGGSGGEIGYGVSIDRAGGAWVTGSTGSADFPTVSPVQVAIAGSSDVFVARLAPGGNGLSFSTYLGGTGEDEGRGIAVRPSVVGGSFVAAYAVGDTQSTNFPTQFPYQTDSGDGAVRDAFVTKIAHGAVLVQQAVLAGGTVSTNPGPLIEASVTSPNAGNVTIVGGLAVGFTGGNIEFDITAPAATAANPLVLRFLIHGPSAPTLAAVLKNLDRVEPCSGAPGTASPDPCIASTTTLLSGDLEVIVNTSTASLWTIADPMTTPVCPATPAPGCQAAQSTKSQLQLISKADDGKDKLTWKWTSSATVLGSDFGTPFSSSGYQLCVYTQNTLRTQALMPAGGLCDGRPCWRLTPTGFLYSDKELTPSGLGKMTLKAGAAGKAKIIITGKGLNLPDTPLPLALPAKVQLIRTDGGTCWEAVYGTALTARSDQFKAKSD